MMTEHPENFQMLLRVSVMELDCDNYSDAGTQTEVINAANLLIRVLPFCLGPDWEEYWWGGDDPLGQRLLRATMK
jgi:hypothetical protein